MWKNLKSYFILEEEDGKKASSTIPDKGIKPPVTGTAPPKATPSAPAAAPSVPEGNVNDRSVKVLMEAMEAANLPGFDYLEYKKALQNLKKMDFTDSVRFQTAYAAAQSMGVTPKQLQDSAQHYLTVLDAEHKKFSSALAGQRNAQVSEKEKQLKQLDADIQRQEAKIRDLQAQIGKSRQEQAKLLATIETSTGKLMKTQADFEKTIKVITDGIRQDMAHMTEFLK